MSLLPRKAREKADTTRYLIHRFLRRAAEDLPAGALVLDAGAGNGRYRPLFTRQRYIASDFCRVGGKNYRWIDVITDLSTPGLRDESVDAVVNIEVLEHVRDPARLMDQLARLLRPGGSLYLTCPQTWGVHEAPYDFYRFTRYALADLFARAGLEVKSLEPMGGYFCLMGKLLSRLPYQLEEPAGDGLKRLLHKIRFVLLKEIFHYWIPFLVVHLDFLDRRKDFTLGYLCHAVKPARPS
ncbi:MAG: class I SAM-dependent methyltransferase [Syntrophobacteraceae bacterium]|jgi:SAM-dependent methyltransferase|nr:class I SAM-dependent methyltransferase [Syntrophobacteraceae bacterium]